MNEKKKPDPAAYFREKYKCEPTILSDKELSELKAKMRWGSEFAENYDADLIDYHRKIGR